MSPSATPDDTPSPRISPIGGPDRHPAANPGDRDAPSRPAASALSGFWREPLLHFLVLGALIFRADSILHPPAKDDREIILTKALRQSFIENFDEDKERMP